MPLECILFGHMTAVQFIEGSSAMKATFTISGKSGFIAESTAEASNLTALSGNTLAAILHEMDHSTESDDWSKITIEIIREI